MDNKLYSYKQVASTTSSPLEQIVMLYDGAIKFLGLAAEDIKRGDLVAKAEHIDRALAIIDYLHGILDMDKGGEVAAQLDVVYELATRDIIRASALLDASYLDSPLKSLREVREAWQQLAQSQAPAAPKARPFTPVGAPQEPAAVSFTA